MITKNTRFIGFPQTADLTEKKSASLNSKSEPFSVEDIARLVPTVVSIVEAEQTSAIIVNATGTPTENAAALQAAYDTAKLMTPNGAALSATNRVRLVVSPGKYSFGKRPSQLLTFNFEPFESDGSNVVFNISGEGGLYQVYPIEGTVTPTNLIALIPDMIGEFNSISTFYDFEVVGVGQMLLTEKNTHILANQITSDLTHDIDVVEYGVVGTVEEGSGTFVVDAEFIDIVSLTGNADVEIWSSEVDIDYGVTYGIKVTGNDVFIKGINCGTTTFSTLLTGVNLLVLENCTGGDYSFGGNGTFSGAANNCTGGDYSFGGSYGTFSGTATNCTGGDYSFGGNGTFSGAANNCTGGASSFGGSGTFSGAANNCTGGDYSFGGNSGTFSGTATNCAGGDYSFGGNGGTFSGTATATNCTGGNSSFGGGGYGTFSGTATNCTGGDNSFGGNSGTFSGTATNCAAGGYSFAGNNGTFSGTATNCTGGDNSFGGNSGIFSGTATGCTGGAYSFGSGGSGTFSGTGRIYYCRLTSGTFKVPASGGKQVLCIQGDNTVITR